jgi:hypothetical protein
MKICYATLALLKIVTFAHFQQKPFKNGNNVSKEKNFIHCQ